MCGLIGFIGKPTNQDVCFELITALLKKTQVRGDDASGYWGANDKEGEEATVYFSKAPDKAEDFVKTDAWQELKGKPLNLFIGHCRASTKKGSENNNINNHPFVSSDYCTALVHNGAIPEFDDLKKTWETVSNCDSEILLRIAERGPRYPYEFIRKYIGELKSDKDKTLQHCSDGEMPIWSGKVMGLVDLFSVINYGAYAVAIGERWNDGTRALWLFRNHDRPLWYIDLRETLGQVYFVSEKKIFREAVDATPSVRKYIKGHTPVSELPTMEVLLLMYKQDKFNFRKFQISRQKEHDTTFEKERQVDLIEVPHCGVQNIRVVTNLDKNSHEPAAKKKLATEETTASTTQPAQNNTTLTGIRTPTDATTGVIIQEEYLSGLTYDTDFDNYPQGFYDFVIRYIIEKSKNQMKDTVSITKETLKESAEKNKIDAIPVEIIDDCKFQQWGSSLREEFKWGNRTIDGLITPLWKILKVGHANWCVMMKNKIDAVNNDIDNDNNINEETGDLEEDINLEEENSMLKKNALTDNMEYVRYKEYFSRIKIALRSIEASFGLFEREDDDAIINESSTSLELLTQDFESFAASLDGKLSEINT